MSREEISLPKFCLTSVLFSAIHAFSFCIRPATDTSDCGHGQKEAAVRSRTTLKAVAVRCAEWKALIRREIRNKIVLRKRSPPSPCDSPQDLLLRPSKRSFGTRPQLRRISLSRKTGVLPFCLPLLLTIRASILAFNCLKTKYRILFSPYPKTAGWESDRQVINRHYTKRLLLCQAFS